jgi:hypothetical protein
MSIAFTLSSNGEISKQTITGTYQVNPDCSASFTPAPGQPYAGPADLAIVDGGKQVMIIATTTGIVLSGVAVRQ